MARFINIHLLQAFYKRAEFGRAMPLNNALQIIRWWESRRIFFNWVVGATGLLTCVLLIICAFASEPVVGEAIGLPDGPLLGIFGIVFYGIAANICYTLGWILESTLRNIGAEGKTDKFGVWTFRAGVTFSILLTLSPAVFCWIAFAVAAITGQHVSSSE